MGVKQSGLDKRDSALNLSGQQLEGVALELLGDVKQLDLSHNRLRALPPPLLRRLRSTGLEQLDLSHNRLRALPEELGAELGASLRALDLSFNADLRGLPASAGRLERLESLDLSGLVRLAELPAAVASMAALRSLRAQSAGLERVPEAALVGCRALVTLNLCENRLESVPASLGDLAALQELRVGGNALRTLPAELGRCAALRHLGAERNRLESLPDAFAALLALEKLDVTGNELRALPPSLDACAALKELRVGSNRIEALPDVGGMPGLTVLVAASNELSALPPRVVELARLEILDFRHNRVRALPERLGQLRRLRHLLASFNPIAAIPRTVYDLKLQQLKTSVPLEVHPGVYLGPVDAAHNLAFLEAAGVSHVINLAGGEPPDVVQHFAQAVFRTVPADSPRAVESYGIQDYCFYPDRVTYKVIDVLDHRTTDLRPHFPPCVDFIADALAEGGKVLVHCHKGVSRSATICTAYLMVATNRSFDDAYAVVKAFSPTAKILDAFQQQLRDYQHSLLLQALTQHLALGGARHAVGCVHSFPVIDPATVPSGPGLCDACRAGASVVFCAYCGGSYCPHRCGNLVLELRRRVESRVCDGCVNLPGVARLAPRDDAPRESYASPFAAAAAAHG